MAERGGNSVFVESEGIYNPMDIRRTMAACVRGGIWHCNADRVPQALQGACRDSGNDRGERLVDVAPQGCALCQPPKPQQTP